jgi:RNA polymerase sigma factor (sigma-70 family)
VELVRGGSEAAFEAIYDRHHRGILAFCRHMLSSSEEGEDALQHTFMAAYRHLVGGDAEIQLRPWLYAIARNRCLSMLRARRERSLEALQEPSTEHLSDEAQRRQDVREVLADVAALPEDQRAALVLAEIGAVSHEEIAMVLDVPRQKVKALVFQARTSLAASRTARETPCTEIREQLANLRGGALRRTTLHRHLRQCAGCRAFREEVSLQRRTLAVALPVIATPGLKDAALGAAFGSASAGGGAAAGAGGAAVAAKTLIAVALVGGGTSAGVEAVRHATPAPPAEAAPAAGAVKSMRAVSGPATVHAAPVRSDSPPATRTRRGHAPPARNVHGRKRTPPGHAKKSGGAPAAESAKPVPPGKAKGKPVPPGQAKVKPVPPGQAKVKPAPKGHAKVKPVPPGQAKVKPVPPGQAKKGAAKPVPPGQAKRPAANSAPRGRAKPAPANSAPPGQAKPAPSASPPGQAGKPAVRPGQGKPKPSHGKRPIQAIIQRLLAA